MDFMPVFIKMAELFLIIIIGYIATKLRVISKNTKVALSKIIINISMPCTILSSVMNTENLPSTSDILMLLVVAFSTYIVLFVIAKLTSFVLRAKGLQKGAVEFGIMFANVGFIGFPVTEAVFGEASTFYTSVFNMPFNLLCYSLGIAMVSGYFLKQNTRQGDGFLVADSDNMYSSHNKNRDKEPVPLSRSKMLKKILLSPALIAGLLCVIMGITKFQGPEFLADTFEIVGGITTPGALIIIGASLAEMPFTEMFTNAKAYIFALIQVVITPLIMYLIYRPICGDDYLLLGETVVISAMPVATAGTMLCVEYGGDEKFMAQITFITTLATVVTIPLIAMVL